MNSVNFDTDPRYTFTPVKASSPSKVIGLERKMLMGGRNNSLTEYYDSL